jgi:glycerol-3-phosphate acyltransferase PlsX
MRSADRKVRIALDALGGKFAPDAIVEGAVLASRRWENLEFKLVGNARILAELLESFAADSPRFDLEDAASCIADAESPLEALESKPDASIVRALDALQRGEVDAVVSAGSTGAQIAASIQRLGLLEGVKRPAIGSYFPTRDGKTFVIDVGANASCKPFHLLQFATMGTIFRQYVDGITEPRVALLSIGEESSKGNQTTREAHELMTLVPALNFIGNIEGRDIYTGKADVIVCDGFTGNVLLKFAESIPDMLLNSMRAESGEAAQPSAAVRQLVQTFDYQESGGVPLLGVNGVSIICHGLSTPKAIANAVGEALKMVHLRVNRHIAEQLTAMGQWSATVKTRALIERFRKRSLGEKN